MAFLVSIPYGIRQFDDEGNGEFLVDARFNSLGDKAMKKHIESFLASFMFQFPTG